MLDGVWQRHKEQRRRSWPWSATGWTRAYDMGWEATFGKPAAVPGPDWNGVHWKEPFPCGCKRIARRLVCRKHSPPLPTWNKGEDDERPPPALGLLALAVPMWIERLRPMPWDERMKVRDECLGIIGCETDCESIACFVTSARVGKPGQVAGAFNAVAKALALGALQPGGVSFAGMHFEAAP